MMKIINAFPGMGDPMTEDETKNFMADSNNNLLIRIGIIDEKGEPNVIPLAYYFDDMSNKIYITTLKTSKKVYDLRKKNIIAYCIDDPTPPYKGVRGKGRVKIIEDINHNIQIVKKFITKRIGSQDHPIAKWLLTETENGNEVILEIKPSYYSTWRSAIPTK
jgi:nitroimidazol reductase NimA-like FMN-containing flavoprotein (pyridoxamine 5'-phosphate oxidase superfamily)